MLSRPQTVTLDALAPIDRLSTIPISRKGQSRLIVRQNLLPGARGLGAEQFHSKLPNRRFAMVHHQPTPLGIDLSGRDPFRFDLPQQRTGPAWTRQK